MRIKLISVTAVFLFVFVGCKKDEPTQTVAWYQANPVELKIKLDECKNNPGDLGDTPNCKNAQQAYLLNMSGPSKVDHSSAFK